MSPTNLVHRDADKSLTEFLTAVRPGRYDYGTILSLSGTVCHRSNIACAKYRIPACPSQNDRVRLSSAAATAAA